MAEGVSSTSPLPPPVAAPRGTATATVTTNPSTATRCVIVQKDEKGFGLRVSGDNPVFVEYVRPGECPSSRPLSRLVLTATSLRADGAAHRAGVQPGDRIIKVNGALVTRHGHQEVVRLIQAGGSPYVSLHLLGRPPPLPAEHQNDSSSTDLPNDNPLVSAPTAALRPSGSSASSIGMTPQLASLASSTTITAPLPATSSTLAEFERTKEKTIKLMIKRENQHLKATTLPESERSATQERLAQLSKC